MTFLGAGTLNYELPWFITMVAEACMVVDLSYYTLIKPHMHETGTSKLSFFLLTYSSSSIVNT